MRRLLGIPAALLLLQACASTDLNEWLKQGDVHYSQKNWSAVVQDYTEAARLDVERWHLDLCYLRRGEARERLGDLDGALEDYTAGIAQGRRILFDALCTARARVRLAKGDRDGALADLVVQLGEHNRTQADPIGAEGKKVLVEIVGKSPMSWFVKRGKDRLADADLDGAAEDFKIAVRFRYGEDPNEALSALRSVEGSRADLLARKGDLHRAKGEILLARQAYRAALDLAMAGQPLDYVNRAMGLTTESAAAREGYEATNPSFERYQDVPLQEGTWFWKSAFVDGREFAVMATRPVNPQQSHLNFNDFRYRPLVPAMFIGQIREVDDVWSDVYFRLVEGQAWKEVVPTNWHRIEIVPGDGIYYLSLRERFRHQMQIRASDIQHRIALGGKLPDEVMTNWRRFDLKTWEALPTDVVHIERHKPTTTTGGDVAYLVVRQGADGRFAADAVSPDGKSKVRIEDYRPESDLRGGQRWLVRSVGELNLLKSGKATHVFGPTLVPLSTVDGDLVTWTNGTKRYFAGRAPGTKPEEDLWALLDAKGTLSLPPGVAGLRPFGHARWNADQRTPADRWLLKFAEPGEQGRQWGLAEWDFSQSSVPIWTSVELVRPATAGKNPTYVNGYGQAVARPESFYDRPILLVSDGGTWTATAVEDPVLPATPTTSTGATRDEALGVHGKRCEEAAEADQKSLAQFVVYQKEAIAKQKAEFEKWWAGAGQEAREKWLLETYSGNAKLWDEAAQGSGSLRFLGLVWKWGHGSPEKRPAVFDRWYAAVLRSYSLQELDSAIDLIYYSGVDSSGFRIPDQEAKVQALWRLKEERHPKALEAKAKKAVEDELARQATLDAVERRRSEHKGYVLSGQNFSWTPPPNPSQERYDTEAYKRGLDRSIQRKSWTPYGY